MRIGVLFAWRIQIMIILHMSILDSRGKEYIETEGAIHKGRPHREGGGG